MKLFLVHCGYYDSELCEGLYESHINLFVAGMTFEEARLKAKSHPTFKGKHMHVDGVLEVEAVDGMRVVLADDASLEGRSLLTTHRVRDLAPGPSKK